MNATERNVENIVAIAKGLEPIVFGTNFFKLAHHKKLSEKHRMSK